MAQPPLLQNGHKNSFSFFLIRRKGEEWGLGRSEELETLLCSRQASLAEVWGGRAQNRPEQEVREASPASTLPAAQALCLSPQCPLLASHPEAPCGQPQPHAWLFKGATGKAWLLPSGSSV